MSTFTLDCSSDLVTVISFSDVCIVLFTCHCPNPRQMDQDWFLKQLSGVSVSEIDIVLISDSRSLYFADMILKVPDFRGIILCTEASYRIGRAFLYDFQVIFLDHSEPLPSNLAYSPLNFGQHFSFGNVSIIPVQNGTGIGNCNWILTKGIDNELISYAAYIIVGLWVQPKYFPAPPNTLDFPIDAFCILPSACHRTDIENSLIKIGNTIKNNIANKRITFIPSFTDESIYLLMNYIKNETPISIDERNHYVVYTFASQKLEDAIQSFAPRADEAGTPPEHQYFLSFPCEVRAICQASDRFTDFPVIFAPYPTLDFGQIIEIRKRSGYQNVVYNCFLDGDFSTNSAFARVAQFVTQIASTRPARRAPRVYAPQDFRAEGQLAYPAAEELGATERFWIDASSIARYAKDVSGLRMVSGTFEGERLVLRPVKSETDRRVPDIDELGLRLVEGGAADLRRDDDRLSFRVPFIEGDSSGAVEFGSDGVTVTTADPLIENFILSLLRSGKK